MAGGGLQTGACGGFLAMASLVFLLLSIFIPGIEWFGVDKLVVFSDEAANASLEVTSSFHFGYLSARQRIETEIDAVVLHEEGYGWCAGTTPGMPAATQRALCGARRLMWACTAIYLLLGLTAVLLSCGPGGGAGAGPSTTSPRRRSLRFWTHAMTVLAAAQLAAGVGLSYVWSGIKRGVEAYYTANYTEVNTLVLRVGWSWYLAGLSGLATTALLLLRLRLSCLAETRKRRTRGAVKPPLPPAVAAAPDEGTSATHHSVGSSHWYRVQSNGSFASSVPPSRASSRSSSPMRQARVVYG